MESQIIKINCDKNLRLLLPILKNSIDNPESSSESYETSESDSDKSDSFDSKMYNFCKELDDTLFLLNTIGQTYLSKDGFSCNKTISFNEEINKNLIKSFIEESKEEDYYIDEISDGEFLIDLEFFMEKASVNVPYKKVIIQYNKHFNVSCECNVKWIMIDDENSQIIISRNNKKLTIDDILYSTRIIAVTYGKTDFMVEINKQEFKILNDSNDILVLKY